MVCGLTLAASSVLAPRSAASASALVLTEGVWAMISKCFVTAATCLYNQSGTGDMGNLTMTQKLDEAELQSALTALSEWQLSEDGLEFGAAIHLCWISMRLSAS